MIQQVRPCSKLVNVSTVRRLAISPKTAHLSAGSAAVRGAAKYCALVSGLGVAAGGPCDPLRLALLLDWLSGMLGGPLDQKRAAQVHVQ